MLIAELRGVDTEKITTGEITYDLRRLRTRNMITRIPHTHRYLITEHGLHTAMFLSLYTTATCPPGWPTSPATPPHHHYAQPPAHTR